MQRIKWSELRGKGTGLAVRCLSVPMAFIHREYADYFINTSLIYTRNIVRIFFFTSLFSVFSILKPAFNQIDFPV